MMTLVKAKLTQASSQDWQHSIGLNEHFKQLDPRMKSTVILSILLIDLLGNRFFILLFGIFKRDFTYFSEDYLKTLFMKL